MPSHSPYQLALGESMDAMHPALRTYFSAIPEGHVGVAEGTFEEFGTPRRWFWPILRLFERRGVVYAGYARDVPFRAINRTVTAPDGSSLATARRELTLPEGRLWVMSDSVTAFGHHVVDRLGTPHLVSVSFDVAVKPSSRSNRPTTTTQIAGLTLKSRKVGFVFGRLRVRVPRSLAPVVRLSEYFDETRALQRVELTIDAPLLGKLYGYSGDFHYRIVEASSIVEGCSNE